MLDLLDSPSRRPGLFAALFSSPKFGNFDALYDPDSSDQITVGQIASRNNLLVFDVWANFPSQVRSRPQGRPDAGFPAERLPHRSHP